MASKTSAVLWFRRDLRLGDHAALHAAAGRADSVLALFVLDDELLKPSGAPRTAFLYGCLRMLSKDLDGRLLIVRGDPATVVPEVAEAAGASSVHVSIDTGPYGHKRDDEVATALAERDVELVGTGSPYAVTPGRVTKSGGEPYRVFTPFYRAWKDHGYPAPAATQRSTVEWTDPAAMPSRLPTVSIPDAPDTGSTVLPEPGEKAASQLWRTFLDGPLSDYHRDRDRPDRDGTTHMSPYLHWGCVHPRTLLADLDARRGAGAESLRSEIAWRDFHADVLWHWPEAARANFDRRFDAMEHDSGEQADALFDAWREGRTGYPIVDAGMRQLIAEGWMHNRVRMVVASFLVKDLHLPWWRGARHFMRHLVDGDLASNQLNWQWVAGSGTDAAPYFRIFNPTTQGEKFDPDGDYVRRYVPELRSLQGKTVHQRWKLGNDAPKDYPQPVVAHADERRISLERYNAISGN